MSTIQDLLCNDTFIDCLEFMLQDEGIFESIRKEHGLLLTDIRKEVREYLASYKPTMAEDDLESVSDSVDTYKVEAFFDPETNELKDIALIRYNARGAMQIITRASELYPEEFNLPTPPYTGEDNDDEETDEDCEASDEREEPYYFR